MTPAIGWSVGPGVLSPETACFASLREEFINMLQIGAIWRYDGFHKWGTPKSSILKGFSTTNHPFGGTSILGNSNMYPIHNLLDLTKELTLCCTGYKQ